MHRLDRTHEGGILHAIEQSCGDALPFNAVPAKRLYEEYLRISVQ